jgi:hypothetical protein
MLLRASSFQQKFEKEINMIRIILRSALALAIAAPAFANDQLAQNLGLEPGVYSNAELATIKGVREGASNSDADTAASLEALYADSVISTQSVQGSSGNQLARFLGVDPADYSMAELAVMKGNFED